MSEELKRKQPLLWWRRILLGLVLTVVVLLCGLIFVSYLTGRQLGAEIIKINRAGEPLTFRALEADLEPNNTGEDTAGYYVEALMSIRPDNLENLMRVNTFYRRNMVSLPANQFPDELREKVTDSIVNFQPVLEKLDKGAEGPLFSFDIGIERGIEVCKTRLQQVQVAAFMLSLRTLELILRGQGDAAANSTISTLKMTRIFDFHPTMLLHAVKEGYVALACEDIHLLLERGHPSEKSLAKLQKVLSETIPENALERMFLAERVYQTEMGRNLIPEKITSRLLQKEVPDLPERLSMPRTFWGRLRVRQKATQYFRNMTQSIAIARRPWPGPFDAIVGDAPESVKKSSKLISGSAAFVRLTARTFVAARCTMLAIGIERYRRSQGELPGSLDDVLVAYIDSIPLDPFTGKQLLYSYDEESYVVYSVGINRQDDSGSVIPKADEKIPQDMGLRIHFRKPE